MMPCIQKVSRGFLSSKQVFIIIPFLMDQTPKSSKTVSFYTVGCRLNQAETSIFVDRFQSQGYQVVEFGEPTDLLILNTCSVTEGAEADCRRVVRKILRTSPEAFVAVTGCYAQTGMAQLSTIPGVDLIFGNQFKMDLPAYLQTLPDWSKKQEPAIRYSRHLDRETFVIEGTGAYEHTRANLKIQDGCNFMCSFCLIPYARGRERSRHIDDALREAEALVKRGHKELVLTGVNIGRYGLQASSLLALIQQLEDIDGLERIRISSIEPTTIPDELIDFMASSSKLCRYFHVPIQSGDDRILQAMNRRYSVQDYVTWIQRVVDKIPGVCLGTDVMVGFPGESDSQFANTRAVLADLPLAYFHVFSYSERPGTPALRFPNKVESGTIKQRSRELTKLSQDKRMWFYQRGVGTNVEVLFESQKAGGLWTGFTDNFIRVGVPCAEPVANQIKNVLVTGVMDGLAVGKMMDSVLPSDQHAQSPSPRMGETVLPPSRWELVVP